MRSVSRTLSGSSSEPAGRTGHLSPSSAQPGQSFTSWTKSSTSEGLRSASQRRNSRPNAQAARSGPATGIEHRVLLGELAVNIAQRDQAVGQSDEEITHLAVGDLRPFLVVRIPGEDAIRQLLQGKRVSVWVLDTALRDEGQAGQQL